MNQKYIYYLSVLNEEKLLSGLKSIITKLKPELSDIINNLDDESFEELINKLKGLKPKPTKNEIKTNEIVNQIQQNAKLKNIFLGLKDNKIDFEKIKKTLSEKDSVINKITKKIIFTKDEEKTKDALENTPSIKEKFLKVEDEDSMKKIVKTIKGQTEKQTPKEILFNKLKYKIKQNSALNNNILGLKNKYPGLGVEKIKQKIEKDNQRQKTIKEITKKI